MNEKETRCLRGFLRKAEALVCDCLNMPVCSDPISFAWVCVHGSSLLAEMLLFDRRNLRLRWCEGFWPDEL